MKCILSQKFGLIADTNIETLHLVETDIDDDYIASHFVKLL